MGKRRALEIGIDPDPVGGPTDSRTPPQRVPGVPEGGRHMKGIAIVVLVVAMVGLGAAGLSVIANQRPAGPAVGNKAVEIVMTEMRFSPNRIDARVGQPVVLRVVNRGAQRHDLAFPSIEMPGLRGVETLTMPGESMSITVTFDKPGTYNFLCTIPGHAVSGMTGAVFVSP